MEGLNLALKKSKGEGLFSFIKVSRFIQILHLLFVDDILILTNDSVVEWREISRVLNHFCLASSLQVNSQKTTLYQYGVCQLVLDSLNYILPYNYQALSDGFRYLGYFLKIDRYRSEDWLWLIERYDQKINHWCNWWLTLGGRLTLIKDVLESQSIYWLTLVNLPSPIIIKIFQHLYNFMDGISKKEQPTYV